MTAEPHNATITYPGGLRARWRWAGSGQGPAVFALSEAGGSLVDLGTRVAADPEPLCRAELRLEGPRGAWTARFASAIYDEPRALYWDDAGLLVVSYGFHTFGLDVVARRRDLGSPVGDADRGAVRVVTPRPCRRPVGAGDVRDRAGRDRRLARRPLGRGDRRRTRRRPAGPHRTSTARCARSIRPPAGTPDRCGRAVDNLRRSTRIWWTNPIVSGAPRARTVDPSPEGPSDTNGGDRINAHVSGRFLRAFCCPRAAARIPAVTPLLPILVGLVALAVGVALLRSFGPSYRVGRLLASTPGVTIAEAIALAGSGTRRLATSGSPAGSMPRATSRTTPTARSSSAGPDWSSGTGRAGATSTIARGRAVPGQRRTRLASAWTTTDLDAGLVVLPRESVGTAADVPDRVPAGTDPTATVRLRGPARLDASSTRSSSASRRSMMQGAPMLAAGLGRPLILTTLQTDEAMRILAADHARRPLVGRPRPRGRAHPRRPRASHGRHRGRPVSVRSGGPSSARRDGRRRLALVARRARRPGPRRLAEPERRHRRRPAQPRPGSRPHGRSGVRDPGRRRRSASSRRSARSRTSSSRAVAAPDP